MYTSHFYRFLIAIAFIFMGAAQANALTAGTVYTIDLEMLKSDGTLTSSAGGDSLGITTTATADASGAIAFSLSGTPDISTCNWSLTTISDPASNVVRRGIAPCPAANGTLPQGISGLSETQTDMLLQAAASAGTDDPILVLFGLAIVKSTGASASDLIQMANFANQGISGAGGYVAYLTTQGVTTTQIAAYRLDIITRLGDPTSGYSKLMKDSVDATTATGASDAAGEAAAILLRVLVQAATTAGFAQDRVLEAMNEMGNIVVPLMDAALAANTLSQATYQSVNSNIGGGIQRLRADKEIEKYTAALATLGASGTDLTTFENASSAMMTSMISAFKIFEQVFTGTETGAQIQAADTVLQAAMNTAFTTFVTSTASSNTRVGTMITNIETALGAGVGGTGLGVSDFQFMDQQGTSHNWPIMMVILTDWASAIKTAGGDLTYTRDNTALPATITWMGTCSTGGGAVFDKTTCESAGGGGVGVWTSGRTNYGAGGQNIPTPYRTIFEVQEDIMILEFVRFAAQQAAGSQMDQHTILERALAQGVDGLTTNIAGTTDVGGTLVSAAQKSAWVRLLRSPQF
jgi:hypothetical protein